MTNDGNQRWRGGRHSYRPPAETIDTAAHDVVELIDDTTPAAFVKEHHYSGSFPAARFRFGLYEHDSLVGVAVFSQPVHAAVTGNVFPALPRRGAVELGRFVLLDRVAGNGETWFLRRCFDLLCKDGPVLPRTSKAKQRRAGDVRGVVSFSDPVPRQTIDGRIVMPGHVGTIYQALGARYLERGRADTLQLLPDGRAFNRRTRQKILAADQGWRGAVAQLVAYGATALAEDADAAARLRWMQAQERRLMRPMAHPGNHRYAFVLDAKRQRKLERVERASAWRFGPDRPYPKTVDRLSA